MLRESATESGSEADDEQNGDVIGKDVDVMSEPPEPVDTSISNAPVLCCGVAVCEYTRVAFRLFCCFLVLTSVAVLVFLFVEITGRVDCSTKLFVNGSDWILLSCVGWKPLWFDIFE